MIEKRRLLQRRVFQLRRTVTGRSRLRFSLAGKTGGQRSWPRLLLRWRQRERMAKMARSRPMFSQHVFYLQNRIDIGIGITLVHTKATPPHLGMRLRQTDASDFRGSFRMPARHVMRPLPPVAAPMRPAYSHPSGTFQPVSGIRIDAPVWNTSGGRNGPPAMRYRDIRGDALRAWAETSNTPAQPRLGRSLLPHSRPLITARSRRQARLTATTDIDISRKLSVSTTRLSYRMQREDSETRIERHAFQRMQRPVDLVWRKSTQSAPQESGADMIRSASPVAARAPLSGLHADSVPVNSPAIPNRDAASAFSLDPAAADRLAEDVLRRVDRRLRIERERRGI